NAVTRSTFFPPLDPWLAPSPSVPDPTINYYHFGYLIQGLLLELANVIPGAVPPAVGFNLALSLLFGLAAIGVFSLGYGLARDLVAEGGPHPLPRAGPLPLVHSPASPTRRGGAPATRGPALATERSTGISQDAARPRRVAKWSIRAAWPYVAAGALAVYMLLIAGNLWTALRRFDGSGLWEKDFWQGIGWNATRVLVIKEGDRDVDYTINEFPSFSFLLGDLHPHVLALPFVLVAVGLAYSWLLRPPRLYAWAFEGGPLIPNPSPAGGEGRTALAWRRQWERVTPVAELLPGAMVLGSLYFLNSWDFPAYFALAQVGALAGAWWHWRQMRHLSTEKERPDSAEASPSRSPFPRGEGGQGVRSAAAVALCGALALALFLPFILRFRPPVIAEGGGLPLGLVMQRSLLGQFVQFWGAQLLLLAPVVLAALLAPGGLPLVRRALGGSITRARAPAIMAREAPGWELALALGGGLLLVLLAERAGAGVLVLCVLFAVAAGRAAWQALGARLVYGEGDGQDGPDGLDGPDGGAKIGDGAGLGGRPLAFALGAICLGAILLAACEVVYIRDFYGGALRRMNTVFKFYYQAWLLLAVGGSVAAFWLLRRLWQRRRQSGGRLGFAAFAVLGLLLLVATSFFPYKVTLLRTNRFQNPATLNGMEWMRRAHPDDYAAAEWLRLNAAPAAGVRAPVVLEATGGAYSEFARMATQTGFPTVLGWDQHERLWRGASIDAEVTARQQDVDTIYTAATMAQVRPLLDKYDAAYVVVGYLEQQKYGASGGLAKFDTPAGPGGTQVAFRQGATTIYKIDRSAAATP
ncbi:MAG: DUF2298 domain-containing protein, partial [Chloroflexota bacterium]